MNLSKAISSVPELPELVNQNDTYRQLIDYGKVLEGFARHASTHAAGVVIADQPLVNYLPSRIKLTSSTAPPPSNPRLQLCMEEYVSSQFSENGGAIRQSIASAQALDLSAPPAKLAKELAESFDKAEQAFEAPVMVGVPVGEDNRSNVPGVDDVMGFHGLQPTAVKGGHEKAFR